MNLVDVPQWVCVDADTEGLFLRDGAARYSLTRCIGCVMKEFSGRPDPQHVSTSFLERQKLNRANQHAPLYAPERAILAEIWRITQQPQH